MRVLVTGAAGFLGAHVVRQLLDHGHTVRAVVRSATRALPEEWRNRAEVVVADLESAPALEDLFSGIEVLIHLAAAMRGTAAEQLAATASVTERLLGAMHKAGTARHLVLAGSCSVYDWTAAQGRLTEENQLESMPYDRDAYTIAKITQEQLTRRLAEAHGWTLTVLRPGFIYGPGASVAAGAGFGLGPLFLVIAPRARLRLTHVANCAAAFVAAVEKRSSGTRSTGTFNIIDDDDVSAWRYAGQLKHRRLRIPVPYHAGLALAGLATSAARLLLPGGSRALPGLLDLRRYRARFKPLEYDNARAKAELGWQCRPLFATGCDVT